METGYFLALALPVLMALVAIGGVLAIKIMRRRDPSRGTVGEAVPARPMPQRQAQRIGRNYVVAVVAVLAALLLLFLVLYAPPGRASWMM